MDDLRPTFRYDTAIADCMSLVSLAGAQFRPWVVDIGHPGRDLGVQLEKGLRQLG